MSHTTILFGVHGPHFSRQRECAAPRVHGLPTAIRSRASPVLTGKWPNLPSWCAVHGHVSPARGGCGVSASAVLPVRGAWRRTHHHRASEPPAVTSGSGDTHRASQGINCASGPAGAGGSCAGDTRPAPAPLSRRTGSCRARASSGVIGRTARIVRDGRKERSESREGEVAFVGRGVAVSTLL